jgi:hypothetical protein
LKLLAFIVEPDHKWPAEKKEDYRLIEALHKGQLTTEVQTEIVRNIRKPGEF